MPKSAMPQPGFYRPKKEDSLQGINILNIAIHAESRQKLIVFQTLYRDLFMREWYAFTPEEFERAVAKPFRPRLSEKPAEPYGEYQYGRRKAPLPGFYHHYEHRESLGDFDCACEALRIANGSLEGGMRPTEKFAICRPLYETASSYQEGKLWYACPRKTFLQRVSRAGRRMRRFTPVTDEESVRRLRAQAENMYGK